MVLAKLDAATQEDFIRTNCPHKEVLNIDGIIESMIKLKKEMPENNRLAIQCLIYRSYRDDFIPNDNEENIQKIAEAIKKIKPNLVQLYSIARIPAQYYVFAIDEERKQEIVKKFKEIINDETIEINYY